MHCPNDRRPVKEAFVKPFPRLSREVEALVVKCHLAPDECAATGQLGKDEAFWRKHQLKCDFAEVECQHCDETTLRRDMAEHLSDQCSVNPDMVVSCPQECGATFRRRASDMHGAECPNTRIRCDLGCKGTFFRKDRDTHDAKYASGHTRFLCIKLDAAETKALAQALEIKKLQQEQQTLQSVLKSTRDDACREKLLALQEQTKVSRQVDYVQRLVMVLTSSEPTGIAPGFDSLRPRKEAPTAINLKECTVFVRLDKFAKSQAFTAKYLIPYDWPEFQGFNFHLIIQRTLFTDDLGVHIQCDQQFPPAAKPLPIAKANFQYKFVVRQGSQVEPLAVSPNCQDEFSYQNSIRGFPNMVAVDTGGSKFDSSWKGNRNSHTLVAPSQVLFVDFYVWPCELRRRISSADSVVFYESD